MEYSHMPSSLYRSGLTCRPQWRRFAIRAAQQPHGEDTPGTTCVCGVMKIVDCEQYSVDELLATWPLSTWFPRTSCEHGTPRELGVGTCRMNGQYQMFTSQEIKVLTWKTLNANVCAGSLRSFRFEKLLLEATLWWCLFWYVLVLNSHIKQPLCNHLNQPNTPVWQNNRTQKQPCYCKKQN